MASRLPVVIAQHMQRAGRGPQFEEALVAELGAELGTAMSWF